MQGDGRSFDICAFENPSPNPQGPALFALPGLIARREFTRRKGRGPCCTCGYLLLRIAPDDGWPQTKMRCDIFYADLYFIRISDTLSIVPVRVLRHRPIGTLRCELVRVIVSNGLTTGRWTTS